MNSVGKLYGAILAFASLVLGLSAPIIGITVQALSSRTGIPLEQAGILTSAHSLGAAIGTILIGYFLDKQYPKWLVLLSPAAIAVSLILIEFFSSAALILFACVLMGFGFGGLLVQLNILTARTSEADKIGSALNLINLFFAIGLILSPTAVSFSPYLLTALLSGLATLAFLFFPLVYAESRPQSTGRANQAFSFFIIFGIIFFLQLGSEVGVRAWLATQVAIVENSDTQFMVTLAISLFGTGILVGRGMAVFLIRSISSKNLLLLSAVILAIGAGLFLVDSRSAPIAMLAAFLMGFAYAPLFPTLLAVLEAVQPEAFGRLSGIFVFIGNLGAIIIPWVQGIVGGGTSGGMSLTFGIGIALVLLMLSLPKGKAPDVPANAA